jgi:ABC-type uncharacterized transport system substrate-binding protein
MWRTTVGIIITLALSILTAPLVADAQPPGKHIRRIGELEGGSPAVNPHLREAFQQGLRALGWVEGQNVAFESRYAEGKEERFPELAAELVRLQVDVIVASSAPAVQAAKHATSTIPIVMATGGHDPVEAGFVASLARPGGNVTGLSVGDGDQFAGKWMELLKEAVPQMSRVLVLWNPTRPEMRAILAATERVARSLGLQLHLVEAHWCMGSARGGGTCVRGNNNGVGVEGRVAPPAEPQRAGDGLQPALLRRFRFQQRLNRNVDMICIATDCAKRR